MKCTLKLMHECAKENRREREREREEGSKREREEREGGREREGGGRVQRLNIQCVTRHKPIM